MRFSIITVCYNPGATIRGAAGSVFRQSHRDVEYIVVDGASTDGTVEFIHSMGERVSRFVSEPDRGIYDALNKGVGMASGDVIGIMHANDMYADGEVLSRVAEAFEDSGADGVYGDLVYVKNDDTEQVVRWWRSGEYRPSSLKYGWMPPHPALFVRRSAYEKARLANGEYFDTSLRIAADYDFMMRLLESLKIDLVYLPQVLVKMRMGGVSNKGFRNVLRKSREDYVAMRRNKIGGLATLIAKNLRKVPQFFGKKRCGLDRR